MKTPLLNPPFRGGNAPKGAPKASEYEPHVTRTILVACHHFEVLVCTEDPYPDDTTTLAWAQTTWSAARDRMKVGYKLTDRITKIVSVG